MKGKSGKKVVEKFKGKETSTVSPPCTNPLDQSGRYCVYPVIQYR